MDKHKDRHRQIQTETDKNKNEDKEKEKGRYTVTTTNTPSLHTVNSNCKHTNAGGGQPANNKRVEIKQR